MCSCSGGPVLFNSFWVLHKTDAIATDQEVGRRALLQKPHGGLACFGIATLFATVNLTSLHDYRFINVKH